MSADADTPLPKTDKALRQLKRFRPREALTIINSSAGGDEMAFARTWALARLLAWAVLDQRPGKRLPKTPGSGAEKSPTRPLRARNARLVGHLTLARLLDQRLQREGAKKDDETLRVMLALFRLCGGFGVFVQSRGAKGLLSNAKRVNRELGYVYRIVLFLCRYKKHIGGDGKFDIDTAKRAWSRRFRLLRRWKWRSLTASIAKVPFHDKVLRSVLGANACRGKSHARRVIDKYAKRRNLSP
jgi:hypothetical protein